MPLTDLIRYFNAADSAGDSTLYADGPRVAAWHRGLRLTSRFAPIVELRQQRIVGHLASVFATEEDGTPVASDAAYARHDSAEAIVHFDRLCRTLHALNFLGQRRHAGGYLQLPIHPRHLLAVQSQHGLVYEAILKRCGLAPEDIVFAIDANALPDAPHLPGALENYRQRGYRLALSAPVELAGVARLAGFAPDIVRIDGTTPDDVLSAMREGRFLIETASVDSGLAMDAALIRAADLGTGSLFGDPSADCRPTHGERKVA